jgi:murein DD-endopeptidase MepM/ murein hydrolase activator NlpD
MSRFFRLAHLEFQPFVKVGDYVTPKTVIGKCGTTGNSTGPHVHLDGTLGKPKSWYQYKSRPLSEYFDTATWAKNAMPYEKSYFTNTHAKNGHIGVDINVAPEDSGLLVYAPCYGRVQYVEPSVSVYRLINGVRKLFQPTWGGGFGNFLWVEKDESRNDLV